MVLFIAMRMGFSIARRRCSELGAESTAGLAEGSGLSVKFLGLRPPESGRGLTAFSLRAARHAAEKSASPQPLSVNLNSKKLH